VKQPNKICKQCGKAFYQPPCLSRIKYCSKECYYIAKKGLKQSANWKENISKGVKKNLPSTAWKKGQHFNPKTEFKKGENLKEKHPNWTGGEYAYRRIFKRDGGNSSFCSKCGEKDKRIVIHHVDWNRKNNEFENLVAVCDKCHRNIHRKNDPNKICKYCGKIFESYKKKQRFCSISCGLRNRGKNNKW